MKLGKKIKTGLVGASICAATALTSYANVEKKPEPLTLEQSTTIEQVNTLYEEKLIEYASDKILKNNELEDLRDIQEKKYSLLKNQLEPLEKEYNEKVTVTVDSLDNQIRSINWDLNSESKITVFAATRSKLDDKILRHYPALLDKDKGNLTYSAEALIEPGLVEDFREIAKEADGIMKKYYKDNNLEFLL